ncbi:hypothetical protein TRP8649_03263 [Pelagimonas phthalicica]|uniref:Uncharacterized protein n=1 Tax=Pelagimonas phthalicica TaxID=1037362 RepID=A0A238JEM4_9RHOB|nr:hypothetical protein [Pelagimonas phthalicica]TDS92081.1 hypothetical protein CLV87_3263 [Pelagimonas phthalicica]SMX29131.1 hypothetical protein TRP8649_03263 [Pelagimonas phthalicica]
MDIFAKKKQEGCLSGLDVVAAINLPGLPGAFFKPRSFSLGGHRLPNLYRRTRMTLEG